MKKFIKIIQIFFKFFKYNKAEIIFFLKESFRNKLIYFIEKKLLRRSFFPHLTRHGVLLQLK